MLIAALTVAFMLNVSPDPITYGYIWLGDSRFVGMNNACKIDEKENNWVVAKVGQGLDWCIDDAVPVIKDITADNPDVDEWILISGLGVNDSYNADDYIEFYDSLEGYDLVLLSVNPLERTKCAKYGYDYKALQDGASAFNRALKKTDHTYVDVATYMQKNGFATIDGVHYTSDTYINEYEFVCDFLEETY